MFFRMGRRKSGKDAALPWESIDSSEGKGATDWEGEKEGADKWSLEAPAGSWEMEGAGEDEEQDG